MTATLVRTAQDFDAPDCKEPVEWLKAHAVASDTDLTARMEVANLISGRTQSLKEFALELTAQIVQSLRDPAEVEARSGSGIEDRDQYAAWLTNLAYRFEGLDRREESLAPSREAVEIYRRLAQEQPGATVDALYLLHRFAASLHRLAACLFRLGRGADALPVEIEVLEVERRIAKQKPELLTLVAGTLMMLAQSYCVAGRPEDAYAATQEAVDIRRRLANDRPEPFLPDLAKSVGDLSERFNELGRTREALNAAREAVELYRRLCTNQPDKFLPDLASSLDFASPRL